MIFLPPLDRRRLGRCRDADALWRAASGCRTAVVAAGPTLTRSPGRIRRADVVVAVLRAAPILSAAGIRVDVVVAAGFRGASAPPNLPRSIYIVDLRTPPVVFDALPGPALLAPTGWDDALGVPHPRISGVTSALAALDVAALLGSARVDLVGWDVLSGPEGTPGSGLHQRGVTQFRERFPAVRIGRVPSTRGKDARNRIRPAISTPGGILWLRGLDGLAQDARGWTPFWGPDYAGFGWRGDQFERLLRNQLLEKKRVARELAGRGFA